MPPRDRTNGWRRRWERCRQPPSSLKPRATFPKAVCRWRCRHCRQTGLLRHTEAFYALPNWFYGIAGIFPLLALMALARIKSLEQLRYVAPGEWGKLLGLDRIPEVRTLRQKLEILCRRTGLAMRWNTELARERS